MELLTAQTTVVELIQFSLAPVFLIVGIGQMLNAVTGRLARVIDRARWYENRHSDKNIPLTEPQREEMRSLKRRMKFANWAITFLTGSAVIICLDVSLLLLNGLIIISLDTVILSLFMLSLGSLTAGLICFFMEVSIATASLKMLDFN
jgi:hypothetical protein